MCTGLVLRSFHFFVIDERSRCDGGILYKHPFFSQIPVSSAGTLGGPATANLSFRSPRTHTLKNAPTPSPCMKPDTILAMSRQNQSMQVYKNLLGLLLQTLHRYQFSVPPFQRHQLVVRAAFRDRASFDNVNYIGLLDRAQSVGNCNRRSAFSCHI